MIVELVVLKKTKLQPESSLYGMLDLTSKASKPEAFQPPEIASFPVGQSTLRIQPPGGMLALCVYWSSPEIPAGP